MDTIDTLKNLERLEALIEDSRHYFGFVKFDEEEFFMLVNKIRASLPEDMRRAGKITQNSEKIVEAAQTEAEQAVESGRAEAAQVVQEARARAQAMVEQSEIVRIASAQAKEIVTQAEAEAREVKGGADDYARDVLGNLEGQINDVLGQLEGRVGGMLSTIQRGRQKLDQHAGRAPAPDNRPAGGNGRAPAERREAVEVAGAKTAGGTANGIHHGRK